MRPSSGPIYSSVMLEWVGLPLHNFHLWWHMPRRIIFSGLCGDTVMKRYVFLFVLSSSLSRCELIVCPQLNFIHRFVGRAIVVAANLHSFGHSE